MSKKELCRVSSSPYSISPSSASPFSPLPSSYTPRAKTMEEVWKDINLSSLHDHHLSSRDDQKATPFFGMTFQDFLARPFSTDHPTSDVSTPYSSQVPPPATMLTLNSVQEIHFLEKSDHLNHNPFLQNHQISQHDLTYNPFVSASGPLPKKTKRCPESDNNNSSGRRHKKMIKNRESAARSRARKQAYTNELELELAHLLEENAKLKKQQQQLSLDVADQQPKKYKLSRTSSATF